MNKCSGPSFGPSLPTKSRHFFRVAALVIATNLFNSWWCSLFFLTSDVRILFQAEISVDSYGNCLNNAQTNIRHGDTKGEYDLMSRYKFNIAVENTLEDSYVTEKFWKGFLAGSVPIYRGLCSYFCASSRGWILLQGQIDRLLKKWRQATHLFLLEILKLPKILVHIFAFSMRMTISIW